MRGRAARCRRERGRRSQQREPAKIGEPPGELNPQQHRGLRSCVTQHFRGRKLVACVRW